ncbi:hypothetical protein AEA09_01480 [Lysinibacillus contaminans]|uniref:Uncharacterized protein n=1 Tax=Lysinibacillus contaminans TaxID=1293441 RepID=A0ABR5K5H2_9BACI|nr:hypothetical protein AEA09_01480 [Lysinibacillus contaminans]
MPLAYFVVYNAYLSIDSLKEILIRNNAGLIDSDIPNTEFTDQAYNSNFMKDTTHIGWTNRAYLSQKINQFRKSIKVPLTNSHLFLT